MKQTKKQRVLWSALPVLMGCMSLQADAVAQNQKDTSRIPCFMPATAQADKSAHSKANATKSVYDRMMISADFLWWRADANNTELATKENVTINDGDVVSKKLLPLNGKWEPGFRIGVGYEFGSFDQWDLLLTYTYFRGSSQNKSATADGDTEFLRQSWNGFLGPIVTEANGYWDVNLNVGDIELARQYKISKKVGLRPHGGVRLAWINFDYHAKYEGLWLNNANNELTQATSMKAKSDLNAGGLHFGTQFLWNFNKHLGLFGDVSASVLYGNFDVKERFVGGDVQDGVNLTAVTEKYREKMHGVRTNLDFLLGLRTNVEFCKGRCMFSLFAGYELSEWFRANELFTVTRAFDVDGNNATFTDNHLSNDIGFQGLTVRTSLAF